MTRGSDCWFSQRSRVVAPTCYRRVRAGMPDQCLEACKKYEAAGVDLLLCLVNPYKIPHENVMQTIELMGKHVIPHFR